MLLRGLTHVFQNPSLPFSLSFLWQMNRHVQSAVLALIHPDVPTSSAQTPYGQATDAESLCAVMCMCEYVCTFIKNLHYRSVVSVCTACVPGCCTKTVGVISCQDLEIPFEFVLQGTIITQRCTKTPKILIFFLSEK